LVGLEWSFLLFLSFLHTDNAARAPVHMDYGLETKNVHGTLIKIKTVSGFGHGFALVSSTVLYCAVL
jgi:hypothetical protein